MLKEKIYRPKLAFHSLRKFSNDYLKKNGVPFETHCQFIGHEFDHVNANSYTEIHSIAEIKEIVGVIQERILLLAGLVRTKF